MYMAGVLFLAMSAIVLVSAHPLESQQDTPAAEPVPLVRDKRTIGVLRDLFPNFSQIIDRKIQMLTRIIFRIVGRLVLQGGGGGGGGGGDDDDRRISITLPTYPPDQLDEEEEDEDTTATATADATDATTNADTENSVSDNRKREVRPKRSPDNQVEEEEEEDLEPDATGDNEVASDNEAESDGEAVDEEDPRNKRFLNFNLGASAGAGGSGGGSGNFLFDIIRRSADRAARMAGTVYRVLAGTDDAGLPSYDHQRSLVAGSGNTQAGDASHAAVEEGKEDVGVPGPLTRLFVVANKGVAALIQDLILRLHRRFRYALHWWPRRAASAALALYCNRREALQLILPVMYCAWHKQVKE